MIPKNEIVGKEMSEDLKTYLNSIPEVTEAQLEALRTAGQKLENDPAFQADYLKSRFVEQMLAAMEESGVNQTELANRWGKSRQYISKLLNEDRRINFTIETMCEFAHLLNRRVDIQAVRPSEVAHVIRVVPNAETPATAWKENNSTAHRSRRKK